MTAPYDFDFNALVDSAIRQKPKEPERWRNRYRAITPQRLNLPDGTKYRLSVGEEWVQTLDYHSVEEAVEGARNKDDDLRREYGATAAKAGINYIYLGPEKPP